MSTLSTTGHRLARFAPAPCGRPQFRLMTADGQCLHEAGEILTWNDTYAWQGDRDQMRAILETVPEGLRLRLTAKAVSRPRPAGRAR
jgi:hypothetical protein